MRTTPNVKWLLCLAILIGTSFSVGQEAPTHEIVRFYFPVGVAGPLATVVGQMADEFNKTHPNITVEAIYSGGYTETLQRAVVGARGGNPPDLAIIRPSETWSAIGFGLLLSIDDFIEAEGGDAFLEPFVDAFLEDTYIRGQHWGLPFQKSTPILYYNIDHFVEAGLDPENPPADWESLRAAAAALTVTSGSDVQRWGIEMSTSDGWLHSALGLQQGGVYQNLDGTETFIDSEPYVEALEFMVALVRDDGSMPASRDYGSSAADFVAGKTAMMYNSPGSLAFVAEGARFNWAVAPLPAGNERASPTGGGSMVMFAGGSPGRKQAAWEFMKWMTSPEQAVKWTVLSGYLPFRSDILDDAQMLAYFEELPQAQQALDALEWARPRDPRTFAAGEVEAGTTDAIESALAGTSSAREALREAQRLAERALAPYR